MVPFWKRASTEDRLHRAAIDEPLQRIPKSLDDRIQEFAAAIADSTYATVLAICKNDQLRPLAKAIAAASESQIHDLFAFISFPTVDRFVAETRPLWLGENDPRVSYMCLAPLMYPATQNAVAQIANIIEAKLEGQRSDMLAVACAVLRLDKAGLRSNRPVDVQYDSPVTARMALDYCLNTSRVVLVDRVEASLNDFGKQVLAMCLFTSNQRDLEVLRLPTDIPANVRNFLMAIINGVWEASQIILSDARLPIINEIGDRVINDDELFESLAATIAWIYARGAFLGNPPLYGTDFSELAAFWRAVFKPSATVADRVESLSDETIRSFDPSAMSNLIYETLRVPPAKILASAAWMERFAKTPDAQYEAAKIVAGLIRAPRLEW